MEGPAPERWEKTYLGLLARLRQEGNVVKGGHKGETGEIKEMVGFGFSVPNGRDRLLATPHPLYAFQSLGHWLWIVQGRADYESIRYYNKAADKFSVDKIRMHGAYGPRLFGIGVFSQVPRLVEMIRERPSTKRAVATVHLPEFDSYRAVTKDAEDEVPCTVALQFLPRDGKLHAVTFMRSQDAVRLLPLDMFVFTMTQELVASECNLAVGPYHHYASSFHCYSENLSRLEKAIAAPTEPGALMPGMPAGSQQEFLRLVFPIEEQIRSQTVALMAAPKSRTWDAREYLRDSEALPEFWKTIVHALVAWSAFQLGQKDLLQKVLDQIHPSWQPYVRSALKIKFKEQDLDSYAFSTKP